MTDIKEENLNELTPAQKAARTRAAKKAAKEAAEKAAQKAAKEAAIAEAVAEAVAETESNCSTHTVGNYQEAVEALIGIYRLGRNVRINRTDFQRVLNDNSIEIDFNEE